VYSENFRNPHPHGELDPRARDGHAVSCMVALRSSPAGYPMAPSAEEWEALSPTERIAVVAALHGEVTYDEMAMPEGDLHAKAKARALDALRGYFTRQRRRTYLAQELPTYYPGEPRFAPDLLAVLDVEDVDRAKWAVSAEGKGLDWVLEVHVGGDRKKDAELNVARYARLGIPEYFVYDRARNRLAAHRLATAEARVYTAILPNHGLYESRVLGLDVQVEEDRLRFYSGMAPLPESEDLIARLQVMYDSAQQRADQEEQLREEEQRRRAEAEQEVARLRAELERLKR
jgi:Uma2 family endonuclease